ncbi:tyrosine--tRNA ligase [Campylobacter sp. RM12640]|uniref:tyrosine--tRNA ligase n=1 Tax=unclassified Campylobacter TaxID=2593542 RepID=UPI001BD93CC0|nr:MULTISPECIES: tyrosine--tRNA ligase [unclassified Campylobacter]MBZ7977882.1 tyrosine--tRNA ligase [Campylobacter sp. RM12654]MBZ7979851.1 tyrosine--tRNA ligase [Campylobacter sp. RM12642]MBZ7982040.1 tyrosine--tRNA ligase [Campylobacter sp. RM12640]MBZ7988904.1 tyrosine--tRNA ligase [Campylobacter sp. RM12635]MBZ7993016.1 tyrosine--tRNA ligase [Campylobacter sp. RM9333]MBZ8007446.1 tyrosine--tRNA ligase [Campylobacter sp. RM9334]
MNLNEIYNDLERGVSEFIDLEKIKNLIKNYYEKGEVFYVKAGFDPTAPDLHLGHSVILNKMRFLQNHGAIVQFLIGDFTAQIGDPTGKSATRKQLSKEEVLKNAKTYEEQVFKILDKEKTELKFNSTWLNALGAVGIVELTSTFSVARMLERDDFTKRFKEQSPISISEFLYPLLQGYDSVALKCDIEMGGTDQKFNLLMGRTLQRTYNTGKEQGIIMLPLLVGLDGVNKMSKSLGNYIGVSEEPNSMYAKLLSISDELMKEYYNLLSFKTTKEINDIFDNIKNNTLHPKVAKENLALEIVERFWGKDLAINAKNEFDNIHSKNEIPSDIAEFNFNEEQWIIKLMQDTNLASSGSEARRAIKANSVSVNGEKISDEQLKLSNGEFIIQVGKRKFAKVIIKG